jgi:subtilisin family serine protease
MITVGAFDDRNTVDWNDDLMEPTSSYVDPFSTNGDRMKPEVVAPGTDITTTAASAVQPFQRVTGTSFAAPHVTGMTALIIQRANNLGSGSPKNRPEVMKAIVIGSANHEIIYQDRSQDGMGAISATWADDLLTGFLGGFGWETLGCFDPNITVLLDLQLGRLTRVVIAWSTNPSYGNYFNQPSADLNIRLYDPLGNLATPYGNGLDNTFETVDFATSIGGTYTLRIKKRRCDMDPGTVAYAWWQSH